MKTHLTLTTLYPLPRAWSELKSPPRPTIRAWGVVLSVVSLLGLALGAGAQQNVYHRDNAGTGLWWHSNNPWYYQTWNYNQDRPDRLWRTANDVFIGHNNETSMTLNGSDWYYLRTFTMQSSATSARTFNPDSGNAGLDLMGAAPRIQNDSPAHHVFNVRLHLHATTEMNTAGGNLTFNAAISGNSGAGLTKTGGKDLILAGANTYPGPTTINGGRLLLTGSLGDGADVTVASGGTLGGTGSVGRHVTVQSGGLLAPGVGIGKLTVSGGKNLTLASGSATGVEGNRAGPSHDQVTGIGTFTAGGTLHVTNTGAALQIHDSFALFSAGSYAGQFAAISPAHPNGDTELLWDTELLRTNGVLRVHHRPFATNRTVFRSKGVSAKIPLAELFPAVDPLDGEAVVLASFTSGGQGATITSNATHIFYLPANDNSDAFDYTVTDARGGTRTATVTVVVTDLIGSVIIIHPGGGAVTVQFYGIPGYAYVVQRSCNTLDNWADLSGVITAPANGVMEYTDSPGGGCNPAFYRIRTN